MTTTESNQAPAAVPPGEKIFRVASVDDDPSEHVLMSMAMEQAEFAAEVVYYHSGEASLETLKAATSEEWLPDVILLDLRMPGLGGYETLDKLQMDPRLSPIPVVIFTSSTRPSEKEMAMERGASLFQTKPHDFRNMAALVRGLPLLALF